VLSSLVTAAGAGARVHLESGQELDLLPAAPLHVVAAGTVALVRLPVDGRRGAVFAIAQRDDVLLPPGPTERVRALTQAELLPLPTTLPPGVAAAVVAALADALRQREESIAILGSAVGPDRLRWKLCQLARHVGRVTPSGVALRLPLTHDLLAGMVGTARETVTLWMRVLERDGHVRREGRTYVVALGALGEVGDGEKGDSRAVPTSSSK
jgi:CRP-like cAMP-binding protein